MLPDHNLEAVYQQRRADDAYEGEVSRQYADILFELEHDAAACLEQYPALDEALWGIAEHKAQEAHNAAHT